MAIAEHVTEIAVGGGEVWLERQRPLVGGHRFIQPALTPEGDAEIVVGLGRQSVDSDRGTDLLDREIMPASLGSDDAKQMEAVEMAGIHREHPPIELFGLAPTAGLVVGKRLAGARAPMRRGPADR